MWKILVLLALAVACSGEKFPALKPRAAWKPDPTLQRQNVAWAELLQNSEIRFLTDNQLSLSLDSAPGVARFHYYPTRKHVDLVGKLDYGYLAKQTQFEGEGARVVFRDRNGSTISLHEVNYVWRPDRVERLWKGGGSKVREEITVQGNVAAVRLVRVGGPPLDIVIRGSFTYQFETHTIGKQPVFCFANGISIAPSMVGVTRVETIKNGYELRGTLESKIDFVAAVGYLPADVAADRTRAIGAPQKIFDTARDSWDFYFTAVVPRLLTANAHLNRLYYYLFYVVRSSMFDIPWEPYQHAYTCPWKTGAVWQWSWNTPMNAVAERWLNDSSLSKSGIQLIAKNGGAMYFGSYLHPFKPATPRLNIFDWYREVDEAQKKLEPKDYDFLSVIPYTVPNAFLGTREVYLMTGDKDFLRENLPLMMSYEEQARRRAEGGSLITPFQMMVDEFDYSLRWKPVQKTFTKGGLQRAFDIPVEMVDVNSYLYALRQTLAVAFRDLGQSADETAMQSLAKRTSADINRRFWDSKRNFYCDARSDNHESIGVRAISGFAPLYVGIVPPARREKLIQALEDSHGFGAPYPFPSVELSNPDLDPNLITYGGDSLITTGVWTLVNALAQIGENERASKYLGRAIEMMTKDGVSSSYSYNSLTGRPNQKKHQLSTQSAILNDLIARYVVGLTPRSDDVFEFKPIAASLAGGELKFGPFRYKDKHWIQVEQTKNAWHLSIDRATMTFPAPRSVLLRFDRVGKLRIVPQQNPHTAVPK